MDKLKAYLTERGIRYKDSKKFYHLIVYGRKYPQITWYKTVEKYAVSNKNDYFIFDTMEEAVNAL